MIVNDNQTPPTVRSSRYMVFDRKSIPMVACGEEETKEEKNHQSQSFYFPAPDVDPHRLTVI